MFTGVCCIVPMTGCDELGKAGEREERRIKLGFQSLGTAECDFCTKLRPGRGGGDHLDPVAQGPDGRPYV